MANASKTLRGIAIILTVVTAVIHFRFALGRFTPLSIAFAAMGIIYIGAAGMILWGKPLFYKLSLVYTTVIVLIYFLALIQPLPPFTRNAFRPGTIPLIDKAVEVILVAVLGLISGESTK